MQTRMAESAAASGSVARRLLDQSASDEANAKVIREMIFHRDDRLEGSSQLENDEPPEQVAS